MAQKPEIVPNASEPQAAPRAKRKRTPSVAKPAFFVIQVLDENGQPTAFDKRHIKIVKVERNAEAVMEMMDNAEYPHAFYLRGIVPVTRSAAAQRGTPSQQAAA